MDDPLVRQLICTSTPEWSNEGPAYSRATIFSVPEQDGSGERLYVGFVDDLWDGSSPARLWRGPVAARWQKLGPAPKYKANLKAKNPRSFRVERLTPQPGGRMQTSIMEIDLISEPPRLRLIGSEPGKLQRHDSPPLGEEVPMNDALRLIVRMRLQASSETTTQRLRAFGIDAAPETIPTDRLKVRPWREGTKHPYLLAVCDKDNPDLSGMHFLPPSIWGWAYVKFLTASEQETSKQGFRVLLRSEYWGKDAHGYEQGLGKLWKVVVGLDAMSMKVVESQLVYEAEHDAWRPPTRKPGTGWTK